MEKNQFLQLCHEYGYKNNYELSAQLLPITHEYLGRTSNHKLPLIWLEMSDSGDNSIAFMNTTYPYLHQVLTGMIDLLYSNTFMAAQGGDALALLTESAHTYAGQFTLVVEGAVPTKDNGIYNVIARTKEGNITALDMVKRLGILAKYVVAIGTCASFGGATAAAPNVTGAVAVSEVLNREVIKVSGCPVNPDWFVGTLAYLLMYRQPELDNLGRPKLFYSATIHQHCQRRSYFDNKDFAKQLGDPECMFSQGCMGPRTGADCPMRQWLNHVSWPVKVNTPCIGCTTKDFPDGSTPFFTSLAKKSPSKHTNQLTTPAIEKGESHESTKNPR